MAKHRKIRSDRLAALHRELQGLPRGQKTERVKAFAALIGVSWQKVYRDLDKAGLSDHGPRKAEPVRPEYRKWVAACMVLALKTRDGKPVPMIDARLAAVHAGLIPQEALDVHINTFHRIAKEMGFGETERKVNRLAAEYAHQAVQFDASTSAYFFVVRELEDGDFLLRLNPRPHPDYKNKPVGKDRLRVIVYSFWELFSGAQHSEYTVSRGENGFDAMACFVNFMQGSPDPRNPVHGVPDQLWADQGPMAKLGSSVDLIQRLGVELCLGTPYEKERMGGVERTHRTRWNFERTFYMALTNAPDATGAAKGEITLSELNARLQTYLARINSLRARWNPALTKLQAWRRSADERARAGNSIRRLPENAIETMATEARRRVGRDGVFQWDNRLYEVMEGLHSRWVMARRSLTDEGKIIVEDIETGKRYDVRPFTPRTLGEYRAFPKSIVDEAREIGPEIPAGSPYAPAETANVVALPTKTRAPDPLPDPLEAGKYGSLGEALRAFMNWHGMPNFAVDYPEEFDTAVELITDSGLQKDYVRRLALDLRQAVKVEGQ
jgi:hypothetical protein